MEEWKEFKVGDIFHIQNGYAFKSGEFVDNSEDTYEVLKIGHIEVGGGLRSDPKRTYVKRSDKFKKWVLEKNDIVMGMTDMKSNVVILGIPALVDKDDTYVLNQRVARLSLIDSNSFDIYFCYYQMLWNEFTSELRKTANSGVQVNLTTSGISNTILYVPKIETQKEIGRVLRALDDKIECNRRINENLEQQAQALFDNVLMNEELPRDKVLKDYAFINPTRSKKKGEFARYIDMSSLPTKGSFPSDWVNKPYNGGMKFQNGDTLMARITPCLENGKTAYINFLDIDEVAFGSTEYIVMAPHDRIPSELFYFLARNKDFVSYAVAHMNGSSGRQRVSATDIESYIMPNIPSDLIKQFGERAEVIMECIKTNSIENRRLAELRDTLLPRLMSGELKEQNIDLINEMLAKGIR